MIQVRHGKELRHANYGWLDSFHTLQAGDGAALSEEPIVKIAAQKDSELLLFVFDLA